MCRRQEAAIKMCGFAFSNCDTKPWPFVSTQTTQHPYLLKESGQPDSNQNKTAQLCSSLHDALRKLSLLVSS